MLGHLKALPFADVHDSRPNRRRHGRLLCDDVRSSLGQVLDLSASGARVRTTGLRQPEKGQTVTLTIEDGHASLVVSGVIVRSVRTGMFHGEVAVEFTGVTPDVHARLMELVRGIAANQSGLWSRGV
jgi:hypothetical protein